MQEVATFLPPLRKFANLGAHRDYWVHCCRRVGRRAASRTWQKLCQREDTGLPWGKPYRGRIYIWDYPKGNQAIRTPSPVQGLTGDPGELTPVLGLVSVWLPGVLGGFYQGSPSGELNWERKRRSYPRVRGNGAASVTPASSSRPLPVTQHTGRNWIDAEIVESCEGVRCRPARSSGDVCQRGANAWEEATLLVEWALTPRGHGSPCDWYAKATASTIQWANLCLETAFPFCCPPWQTKGCSELLTLWVQSTYMRNALTGHSNTKAGSASSEGSACMFTTWSRKGVVGTLGTYPGRVSRQRESRRGCHMVPSPWERRSFLRGMRQWGAVAREISSGNQVWVGQCGTTSRTCSSSSLSLHSVCASRLTGGNAFLRKARGQLCASASVPRGPSVREKYSWQWEDLGEANKSTWASPNRLQISRIVSGWSRPSPGNVSCRESTSAAQPTLQPFL